MDTNVAEQNSTNTASGTDSVDVVASIDVAQTDTQNASESVEASQAEQDSGNSLLGVSTDKGAESEASEGHASESEAPEINADALKLAEDSLVNEQDKTTLIEFAQQHKLDQDMAQATLDLIANVKAEAATNMQATQQEAYKAQVEEWKSELARDKDLGGERLQETDRAATQVLVKFWGADFLKVMQDNELGVYPAFVRGLVNVHKALSPQSLQEGEGSNADGNMTPQERLDVLYPPELL